MKKFIFYALTIISITVVVLVVGYFIFMSVFVSAYKTDCKKHRQWKIGDYKVSEYKCLGWAGPHYYQFFLYKGGEKISVSGSKLDSCTVEFKLSEASSIKFNICNNRVIASKLKN